MLNEYFYFDVALEYSSFTYPAANLENKYSELRFYGIDTLEEIETYRTIHLSNQIRMDKIDNTFAESSILAANTSQLIISAYKAFTLTNCDTIIMSSAKGIEFFGENYSFAGSISANIASCALVEITGTTSDHCTVCPAETGVQLIATEDCANLNIGTFSENAYVTHSIDNPTRIVSILGGENDSIIIEPKNEDNAPTSSRNSVMVSSSKSESSSSPDDEPSNAQHESIPVVVWILVPLAVLSLAVVVIVVVIKKKK